MDYAQLYKDTVKKVGFEDTDPIYFILPTGSYLLDRALGLGGYPGGRIIEVYGPEGSGKTTLCMHAMAEAQKLNLPIGMVDMEASYDDKYGATIGIQGTKNEDWAYAIPDTGEQALETVRFWVEQGIKLIVVDSVSAMVPKAELEGNFGEAFMGLQARMMSQGMRMLTGILAKAGAIVIFINQIRSKIGVMFGSPETTTGGNALKFYASVRLEIRANGEEIKEGTDVVGRYSTIKTKKNKVGPPMRTVQVPIVYGKGIDQAGELFDILLTDNVISRRGSNYYADGEMLGAGKANTVATIVGDLDRFKGMVRGHGKI